MPRNKGIGRKFKRKRDTSKPYLRPKGKQKLETTDRAEEPCNVDSDDEEFSDCDDGFGVVINDEMRHKITKITKNPRLEARFWKCSSMFWNLPFCMCFSSAVINTHTKFEKNLRTLKKKVFSFAQTHST